MDSPVFLTRQQLATRWQCGLRTIDRRRTSGRLPWVNLADGDKPLVRFRLADVEAYEERMVRGLDVQHESPEGP